MTVSMWNTILDWNRLNKRESFMTVIIKVNPMISRHEVIVNNMTHPFLFDVEIGFE